MACTNCGSINVKHIPAGVSKKTGKAYNEFYKCNDCGKTFNSPNAPKTPPAAFQPPPMTNSNQEVLNALRELYSLIKDTNRGIGEILRKLEPTDDIPEPRF